MDQKQVYGHATGGKLLGHCGHLSGTEAGRCTSGEEQKNEFKASDTQFYKRQKTNLTDPE
jgi:hypothetical protein